jgi:hypothetical protein
MQLIVLYYALCDAHPTGYLKYPIELCDAVYSSTCRVQMRELNKKEAKLYGKMFAALGKGSSDAEQQQQQQPADGNEAAADAADAAAAPMETDAAAAAPAATAVVEGTA